MPISKGMSFANLIKNRPFEGVAEIVQKSNINLQALSTLLIGNDGVVRWVSDGLRKKHPNLKLTLDAQLLVVRGEIKSFLEWLEGGDTRGVKSEERNWTIQCLDNSVMTVLMLPISTVTVQGIELSLMIVCSVDSLARKCRYLELMSDSFDGFMFVKKEASRMNPLGTDPEKRIEFVEVNQRLADQIGLSKSEVCGLTDYDTHRGNKEENDFFCWEDRQVLKTGKTKFIPYETYTYSGGKKLFLATTKKRVTDLNGEHLLVGASFDVSKQQNELKHSDALLDHMFQSKLAMDERFTIACTAIADHARSGEGGMPIDFDAIQIIQHLPIEKKLRVVAVSPENQWASEEREWKDQEGFSVSGWVLNHGPHGCGDYSDPNYRGIRPFHPAVKASVCVPIVVGSNTSGQGDYYWGTVSAVAFRPRGKHDIERAKRTLVRYAAQVGNIVRVTRLIEQDRTATSRFTSLVIMAHDIGSHIQHAGNSLELISESTRTLMSVSKEYSEGVAQNEKTEIGKLLLERSVDEESLREHLIHIRKWHAVCNKVGRFILEREELGVAQALEYAKAALELGEVCLELVVSNAIRDEQKRLPCKVHNYPGVTLTGTRDEVDISWEMPPIPLPLINGDEALIVSAVGNLLRNAIAYAPSERIENKQWPVKCIRISVGSRGSKVYVRIANRLPASDSRREKLEKLRNFFRSDDVSIPECPGYGTALIKFAAHVHSCRPSVTLNWRHEGWVSINLSFACTGENANSTHKKKLLAHE